jgi:hypothetical protein
VLDWAEKQQGKQEPFSKRPYRHHAVLASLHTRLYRKKVITTTYQACRNEIRQESVTDY